MEEERGKRGCSNRGESHKEKNIGGRKRGIGKEEEENTEFYGKNQLPKVTEEYYRGEFVGKRGEGRERGRLKPEGCK